jgi:mannose-6-phosphate isomerase-like protein (cupin superfamily)
LLTPISAAIGSDRPRRTRVTAHHDHEYRQRPGLLDRPPGQHRRRLRRIDVPGEFRRLGNALGADQLAVTLIRVPPRSDFEQVHEEIEELYLVTKGTLTMRFGNDIHTVQAPAAVRVAPRTARSHRNEGDEAVEMWAISRKLGNGDATKLEDFWEPSPAARQTRS